MHFFVPGEYCRNAKMKSCCHYWFKAWTFTNRISHVLHIIIIICTGQRGSTLPAASADSLSELISELERPQYDCNVFMELWGATPPCRYIKAALWHLCRFQNTSSWRSPLKPDGYQIFYGLLFTFAVLEGYSAGGEVSRGRFLPRCRSSPSDLSCKCWDCVCSVSRCRLPEIS